MNILPLKEREQFVVRGLVYKVIRARPNGKFVIRLKGVYTPPQAQSLSSKEKKAEQEFFKEKEKPTNEKKDDSRTREETIHSPEGDRGTGSGNRNPQSDDSESPSKQ